MTPLDKSEIEEYGKMRESPLYFISKVWGLVPQPILPKYYDRFSKGLTLKGKDWDEFCKTVTPEWFAKYHDGEHVTWQQTLVLYGIEKALRKEVHARISIVSGHGTGKSTLLSYVILWFLFVHPNAQVPCTAPTASGLYDVLWKELKKWLNRMPQPMAELYEWQTTHIRMKENPETWFARAKTSSKENTEALAGVHADWVLVIGDEASGIEEQIFETMEGALTSGNILVILTGNGTRNIGYFYDSHHKDRARWQTFAFDSRQSPRVDETFIQSIVEKYGKDSVQFTIRVAGGFPPLGAMDDKGYMPLFNESELHIVPFDASWVPVGRTFGALDASGEGQDTSEWAVKDRQRAGIVATEQESTPASMGLKSLTVCDKYKIAPVDFFIDAFGKGHPVAMEMALASTGMGRTFRVSPVNTGDVCEDDADKEQYINIRAMAYYKMMLWCRAGGELMDAPRLKEELLSIRYRRTLNGRIQIMPKLDMKQLGFPSPNKADALSMCFINSDGKKRQSVDEKDAILFRKAMQRKMQRQSGTMGRKLKFIG